MLVMAKVFLNFKFSSETIDLCRKLEAAGCSYLTVHARTVNERFEPIHTDYLKMIKQTIKTIPIVANGDLFTLDECYKLRKETNVDGVMCARGLLENPALFANHSITPIECIHDWVKISIEYGTPFIYFHSVLMQMLQKILSKSERIYFNSLTSTASVIDFLNIRIFNVET